MYSTIGDLLEWAKSGVGDSLLSDESIALRNNFQMVSSGLSYGLGKRNYLDDAFFGGFTGHDGDTLGFRAYALTNDEYGVSFASVVNTCRFKTTIELALMAYLTELTERAAAASTPTAPIADMPAAAPAPAPSSYASPSSTVLVSLFSVASTSLFVLMGYL